MRSIAMLAILSLTLVFSASASLIPMLQTGPVPLGGGDFAYVYQATLSDQEQLDPVATNGVTCVGPGTPVTLVQCSPTGTFFTIYDVAGLDASATLAASVPAGWGVSFNAVGPTPSTLTVPDSGAIFNVTFKYTGPVVSGPVTFTGFEVISTDNDTVLGFYSSQATEKSNGLTHQEDSFIDVPGNPANTVPEPVYLAPIGAGLIGLAFGRKRLRR